MNHTESAQTQHEKKFHFIKISKSTNLNINKNHLRNFSIQIQKIENTLSKHQTRAYPNPPQKNDTRFHQNTFLNHDPKFGIKAAISHLLKINNLRARDLTNYADERMVLGHGSEALHISAFLH